MYSWILNHTNKLNLPAANIEYELKFLKENMEVHIMTFNSEILGVELPNTVELEVTETEPGIKGDTSSGGTKPAILETGLSCTSSFLH